MQETLKRWVRAVVPATGIQTVKAAHAAVTTRDAREAFQHAAPGPQWLAPDLLPVLQLRYPTAPPYHYDARSLWIRGIERHRRIAHFLTADRPRTLEVACHDAMVSAVLAQGGARATAIDLSIDNVDPRARKCGVELVAADAEQLPFEDAAFDCVFSYNAFEHFDNPRAAFAEALRVVRPGGILYFRFGPLYRSSYGLHAMHAITVPFLQYLWDRSVLGAQVEREGLRRIEFETLNEWTLQQFRDLWAEWRPWVERIAYREIPDVHGMDLVRDHPSCFRHQTDRFEDLLVANLEIALRRTDRSYEPVGEGCPPSDVDGDA